MISCILLEKVGDDVEINISPRVVGSMTDDQYAELTRQLQSRAKSADARSLDNFRVSSDELSSMPEDEWQQLRQQLKPGSGSGRKKSDAGPGMMGDVSPLLSDPKTKKSWSDWRTPEKAARADTAVKFLSDLERQKYGDAPVVPPPEPDSNASSDAGTRVMRPRRKPIPR